MGIPDWLYELARWLLSLGIGASTIAFLGKKVVDSVLTRDLEKVKADLAIALEEHRSQLALQAASEVEQLKASLKIAAHRQEVGFSEMYARRAKVVSEVYSRLATLQDHAQRLMGQLRRRDSPHWSHEVVAKDPLNYPLLKEERERCDAIAGEYRAFRDFFRSNRIFVSQRAAAMIDHVALSFAVFADHYAFNGDWYEAEDPQVFEAIRDSLKSMSDYLESVLPHLEEEFRALLSGSV